MPFLKFTRNGSLRHKKKKSQESHSRTDLVNEAEKNVLKRTSSCTVDRLNVTRKPDHSVVGLTTDKYNGTLVTEFKEPSIKISLSPLALPRKAQNAIQSSNLHTEVAITTEKLSVLVKDSIIDLMALNNQTHAVGIPVAH